MPVLDAKALETDPDGLAFLRAVLKPTGKPSKSDSQGAAAAGSRRALIPPPSSPGEMPLAIGREAPIAAPAS